MFSLGNTASELGLSQCKLMWKEFSGHLCFSPKCCGCALPSVYHGLVFVDFTSSAGLVFHSRWLLGLFLVGLCTVQFCTLLSPMSQQWFASLSPDSNIAFGMPLSWAPALRPFCARVWATPLTLLSILIHISQHSFCQPLWFWDRVLALELDLVLWEFLLLSAPITLPEEICMCFLESWI